MLYSRKKGVKILKLKRIITLLSVTFLFSVLLIALSTTCAFAAEETTTGPAILLEIKNLRESGKNSNANINQTIIDLTNVTTGSAITFTYIGEEEDLTVNTFDVLPQEKAAATDKITRFIFELTNNYRPETELALQVAEDNNTVWTFTCGEYKNEAMLAILAGLVDCLGHKPIRRWKDDDSSENYEWVEHYKKEEMTKIPATSFHISTLNFNSSTYLLSMSAYRNRNHLFYFFPLTFSIFDIFDSVKQGL